MSQTATSSGVVVRANGFTAVPGYEFEKWNTASDGSGTSFMPNVATGTLGANLHLFAIWKPIPYQVTITGGGPNTTGGGTFTVGQTVTISAGTRDGYTFTRWNATGVTIASPTVSERTFSMPPNNVTLEAVWTATPFQVTVNGSHAGAGNTGAGQYTVGQPVTINAGTRDGFNFSGWTVNSGGVTLANASNASTTFNMPAGPVTVTAAWTQVAVPTFAVTVNGSHAGTGNTGAGSYAAGQTVTINAGTQGGFNFSGWTVSPGGVTLANASNATTTFTMPAGPVTVTANWTQIPAPTFAVTVNGSYAGTGNTGTGSYAAGQTVTIRAGTRTTHNFNGWTVTSGGVTLANASNATTTFTMPAGPVTVTANWTQIPPPTFTVTVSGSQDASSGAGTYTAGQTVTIRAGTNNGSTFNRWNTSSSGVTLGSATNATTTFIMPANNVALTATWTQNQTPTFQVTVSGSQDANSGTGPYTPGNTVTIRAGTRSGFTFAGWTVTSGGVTLANASNATTTFTMPSGPVTVTANWTQNQAPTFQVLVNGSNAPNSGAGTYTAGQTVTIRAGTFTGNTFNRWNTGSNGVSIASPTSIETTFVMPSNNVSVTATWTPNSGNGGGTTPPPGGGTTTPPGIIQPPPPAITTPPGGGGTTPPDDSIQPGDESGNGNPPIVNAPIIVEPPEQQPQPQGEQRFEPIDEPPPINAGNNSRHVVRQLFGDNHPVMTIGDTVVPLVGPRHIPTWALLNLILLVVGVF